MVVEITSPEELHAWLEDKPREWAQVIALRSALRSGPLVFEFAGWQHKFHQSSSILAFYRLVIASVAAIRNLGRAEQDGDALVGVLRALNRMPGGLPTRYYDAFRVAGEILADPKYIDDMAPMAVSAAHAAIAHTGGEVASLDFWQITSNDAIILGEGSTAANLLGKKVWQEAPHWWNVAWEKGLRWLSASGEGFEVWREWNYGRLEGLPHAFADFDDAADKTFYRWIVEQDDEWWSREPAEVNAEIAKFVDDLRKPKDTSPEPSPPSEEQSRQILAFTADPEAYVQNDKLAIRASAQFGPLRSTAPKNLAQTLIDLSRMLADGLEDNAPRALRSALTTYSTSLERDTTHPSSDTLDPAAGVVRALYTNEGNEVWAKGLSGSFKSFLEAHARLFGKLPEPKEQAEERAKLVLNEKVRQASLSDDIDKFRVVAKALKDAGASDAQMDDYLSAFIELGTQIAFGGPDLEKADEASETAPGHWTPKDLYRANAGGLALQMEARLATALAVTSHPQFQSVLPVISDFVVYILRYFV